MGLRLYGRQVPRYAVTLIATSDTFPNQGGRARKQEEKESKVRRSSAAYSDVAPLSQRSGATQSRLEDM